MPRLRLAVLRRVERTRHHADFTAQVVIEDGIEREHDVDVGLVPWVGRPGGKILPLIDELVGERAVDPRRKCFAGLLVFDDSGESTYGVEHRARL